MSFTSAAEIPAQKRLEELRAFVDPETWETVRAIVETFDLTATAGLQEKHAADIVGAGLYQGRASQHKYLDHVFWTWIKLELVRRIGLHELPPMRIWDIGAGACHFARVCRHYGHEVLSTDIDNTFYDEVAATMGETRTVSAIEANKPTPDWGAGFDLVTAIAISFNQHADQLGKPYWTVDHWRFLFDDLVARQLNQPGRVWLRLNKETHGGETAFNRDLIAFCQARGAEIDADGGVIDWVLRPAARQSVRA